jgi:L-serine dehydratase
MLALKLSNTISIFDIIGPVMIGPSSSHTAGAARIGYSAYQALKQLGEKPKEIKIKLYNSFSDTGEGHKTDLALLAGCLGFKPEDEQIIHAKEVAQKKQIKFEIKWGLHSFDFHPNTAVIKLKGEREKVQLIGYSLGGGLIKTFSEKNFKPYNRQSKQQLKGYFSLNNFTEKITTGRQFLQLVLAFEEKLADSRSYQDFLNNIEMSNTSNTTSAKKITITQINQEMHYRWQVMKESIDKGTKSRQRAETGLFGDDANRILKSKLNLISPVIENGITYSIGVAEHNARMGKIVAAPTAGSCGIIPGTLRTMQEQFGFSDTEIVQALIVAGAFGAITARQVELAGAVAGCQAEIGVAGAMAAAAGTFLLGGNLKKMENAASLVLANLLGLTCDPVMGRVEVPCILRNGMVTAMVFSAIELALDGVDYYIPYDEVVSVMKNIGTDMDEKYRETSEGGLATTKTACQLCAHKGQCLR